MSPLPLGSIDFEDQIVDGVVNLLGDHWYLGNSDNVKTIREAQPQDDDEPEVLTSAEHPAILLSCERQGNGPDPASNTREQLYVLTADILFEGGQDRKTGKKMCGRIREEFITYVVGTDGSATVVTGANQLWVQKESLSVGAITTGLKKNRHIFWSRVEIPISLFWDELPH